MHRLAETNKVIFGSNLPIYILCIDDDSLHLLSGAGTLLLGSLMSFEAPVSLMSPALSTCYPVSFDLKDYGITWAIFPGSLPLSTALIFYKQVLAARTDRHTSWW